jgi:hypothetical protein
MPLVFFLGIAFFTSTVLVINSGKDVTHRIETQDGVDAAAVTAATTVARGMNYIASNNISMAKLLASIVILRAFPPAIEDALTTLDVWEGVAIGMIAAGKALQATVFGAAAGAVLEALGQFIKEVKIPQERKVLEAVKKIVEPIRDAWAGKDDSKEDGIAWKLTMVLAKAGDALAYFTPLIAQYSAKRVYRANLTGDSVEADCWVLPLYPALPACRGKFKDFEDPVTGYVERWSEPIIIIGWVVVTLSLFPVHFENRARQKLRALFTGNDEGEAANDPDTERVRVLNEEIEVLRAKLVELEGQRAAVIVKINDLRARQADGEDGLEDDILAAENEKAAIEAEIEEVQEQIEEKQEQISEIMENKVPNDGGEPGAGTPPDDTSPDMDATGGAEVQDRKDYYPWLIDGSGWPKSFTYFVLGWRTLEPPLASGVYSHAYDTGWVYASARVLNPTKADLWTPDWRAKLVRSRLENLPTNPIGTLPSACGEGGGDAGGELGSFEGETPSGTGLADLVGSFLEKFSKH